MPAPSVALVSMHTNPFAEPGSGDVGGMNVVVRHAAAVLRARGWQVDVYIRRSDATSPDVEHHDGVRLHRLTAGPARPATKTEQEAYVAEFGAELRSAHGRAAAEGAAWHLIHSHHWFSGAAALPVAQALRIPHVQSYHSIAAREEGTWELGERPEGPGRVPAEHMLAEASDAVIAVSQAEAATAIAIGASPERVHIATPGVDHTVFHPGEQDHDPFGLCDRATILVAARLEPLKGLELAIETIALLPEGERPRLTISGAPTGGFAGYDHELHRLANSLGVTKDVWFAGPLSREELAAAMRHAQVVMVPSYSETYGLVALEAAACGTPVLAAKVGGLVDAVDHGHTGILVEGRDPRVWARELASLLGNPELQRRMSAEAVEHASAFTWQAMVSEWVKIYARLRG